MHQGKKAKPFLKAEVQARGDETFFLVSADSQDTPQVWRLCGRFFSVVFLCNLFHILQDRHQRTSMSLCP